MNSWILLILLTTKSNLGGAAIETIEFDNESSCLLAQVQIAYLEKTNTPSSRVRTNTVCIRKGATE